MTMRQLSHWARHSQLGGSAKSELSVHFAMGPGLVLRLRSAGSLGTFSATPPAGSRTDPLADLVRALRCFAAGAPDVACRWPGDEGGYFLDLSRVDDERCGFAVHTFADPGWQSGSPWLPQRGALAFAVDLPIAVVIEAFILGFDQLRTEFGADFGERWPWPFPAIELSRLAAAGLVSE